jgi:hypothetical protein
MLLTHTQELRTQLTGKFEPLLKFSRSPVLHVLVGLWPIRKSSGNVRVRSPGMKKGFELAMHCMYKKIVKAEADQKPKNTPPHRFLNCVGRGQQQG